MAISVGILFAVLAGWRLWRRGAFGEQEWGPYLVAAGVGALALAFTAHLGGTIVYRYGGGIPSEVMRAALEERDGVSAVDSVRRRAQTGDSARAHTHAPGTPPHRH